MSPITGKFDQALEELSDDLFRAICQHVYEHCGLSFGLSSKFIVQKRIAKRLLALQIDSYQKYYYHLLYDRDAEEELDRLVELLTTSETYFFREQPQLRAFQDEILPEIVESRRSLNLRTLRIWSAGCATGEEPYTIAMLMLEKEIDKEWKIEIFGSDINRVCLQKARSGLYREISFRTTDSYFRNKYFEKHDDKLFRIKDEVKRHVTFGRVNLFDMKTMMGDAFDVIFCRNVIIYFDKEAKRNVITSFYERIAPGGFLLLGHSETLLNVSTQFKLRHLKADMVYQK